VSDDEMRTTTPCGDGGASGLGCDEAVHQLYDFLDGELTLERRAKIAAHLDNCAPCGSAAHFEEELRQVIHDGCHDRVPPELIERVAAALAEEGRHVTDA
jgi:mycothiol system anti-sigma-R factor